MTADGGGGGTAEGRLGEMMWTEVGKRIGERAFVDMDMVILRTKRLPVLRRTLEILGEGLADWG